MKADRAHFANILVGIGALRIHPMRTMLSVLGILIGSAALVATMAVSDGMVGFARATVLRETSVQVITVSPRTSRFEDGEWVPVHDYPIFGDADVAAMLAEVPGLQSATLALSGRARVRRNGVQRSATIALGTARMPDFGTLRLATGRFFSVGEAEHNSAVVVLNYALAQELSPGRDPLLLVGNEVRVRDRTRRVIGILEPTGFEDRDSPSCAAYAPIRAASALLEAPPRGRFAPVLQLQAPTVESVDELGEEIRDALTRRFGRWQDRIHVEISLEQLRTVEEAFLLLKLFVGALVGISLLVGGIGIMNVLLASVAERTREIGIRKSVGARGSDILLQFLTESVAIAFAGSCLGLVIGMLIAFAVTAFFRAAMHAPVYPVLSAESVLIATLSSSVIGLVFGTYPARRAAGLSPILALAHE